MRERSFLLFEVYETGQHFAVDADNIRGWAADCDQGTRLTFKDDLHLESRHRTFGCVVKGSFVEVTKKMAALFKGD